MDVSNLCTDWLQVIRRRICDPELPITSISTFGWCLVWWATLLEHERSRRGSPEEEKTQVYPLCFEIDSQRVFDFIFILISLSKIFKAVSLSSSFSGFYLDGTKKQDIFAASSSPVADSNEADFCFCLFSILSETL
jgi:hypothetical protein